jgi:hypothetical protein
MSMECSSFAHSMLHEVTGAMCIARLPTPIWLHSNTPMQESTIESTRRGTLPSARHSFEWIPTIYGGQNEPGKLTAHKHKASMRHSPHQTSGFKEIWKQLRKAKQHTNTPEKHRGTNSNQPWKRYMSKKAVLEFTVIAFSYRIAAIATSDLHTARSSSTISSLALASDFSVTTSAAA